MIDNRRKERKIRKRKMLLMLLHSGGTSRAEYLRKSNLFGLFGQDNYWFPRILPAEPSMIYLHNNVNIATDVYFCDHDVIHHMFNNIKEVVDTYGTFSYARRRIELFDNVFIGAHSIIMGGVKIGLFFASTFCIKLQNIFVGCCKTVL